MIEENTRTDNQCALFSLFYDKEKTPSEDGVKPINESSTQR